jgi:hypothetical protein
MHLSEISIIVFLAPHFNRNLLLLRRIAFKISKSFPAFDASPRPAVMSSLRQLGPPCHAFLTFPVVAEGSLRLLE